jgi:DNA-binding transcriptional LysR family regulator
LNTLLLELMAEAASERPRVVVATTFMVAATILPRLIRRHAEREPDTEVVLRDLRQAAAIDSVRRGESDLAVLALDSPQPGLRFQCLAEDELVVVVPAGHRLAAGESVSLASLVGQNLMLLEQYASIEAVVKAESRQAGLAYRPGAKALSLPTLLGMLDAGVGITILPRSMAQHNAATPRVVLPIAGHKLTRRYGLLTPERRRMSEAARRFCAFLRAEPLLGPPVRAQVRE